MGQLRDDLNELKSDLKELVHEMRTIAHQQELRIRMLETKQIKGIAEFAIVKRVLGAIAAAVLAFVVRSLFKN